MNNIKYRLLSEFEKEVLKKLLYTPFQGNKELLEQSKHAQVKKPDGYSDNYGSIEFIIDSDLRANVKERVPVEGTTVDESGNAVLILLHVVDGLLYELEILRMDGEPMVGLPDIDKLKTSVKH